MIRTEVGDITNQLGRRLMNDKVAVEKNLLMKDLPFLGGTSSYLWKKLQKMRQLKQFIDRTR
jgi:hypothetical protein